MREILRVAGLEGTERKGSEVAKENKVYVFLLSQSHEDARRGS
jgi:hypothetical protein